MLAVINDSLEWVSWVILNNNNCGLAFKATFLLSLANHGGLSSHILLNVLVLDLLGLNVKHLFL